MPADARVAVRVSALALLDRVILARAILARAILARVSVRAFCARALAALALTAAIAAANALPAQAHPHVWVKVRSALLYAPDGMVTGIRHDWSFDDMFSTFALQGITAKKAGEYTREELAPLAHENVTSLKEYDYFTYVTGNGKKVPLKDPVDYFLDYDAKDTILTLHFTLPLKTPVKVKDLHAEIYDPDYFIEFTFVPDAHPVTLAGAAPSCKLSIVRPETASSQGLPQSFFDNLAAGNGWGANMANKIDVRCP